ncbi:MAG: ribonuclease HII [Nitrososphaerota archaeon]|jgi:ribonuclease HII|nr:ribonuclease HII [Nitrososphaerota archaeon]
MLIAGVDEAGRGCVIGPLVVVGITVSEENLSALLGLGVRDSKQLSIKKREALYPEILNLAQSHHIIKVSPALIDRAVCSTKAFYKLNRLEAQTMAKIIQKLSPDKAFVDAADVLPDRFGEYIKEGLSSPQPTIVSEHKADRNYSVVAAASIVAKIVRDGEIHRLHAKYGDFGSGYLADDRTLFFLRRLLDEGGGVYPSCVRKSWAPARRVKAEYGSKQQTLG